MLRALKARFPRWTPYRGITGKKLVAILGVLRAGAAYVPLDTDHPRTRLAFILEDAQLEIVLAPEALIEKYGISASHIVAAVKNF